MATADIWSASVIADGFVSMPVALLRLAPMLGLSAGELIFIQHVMSFKHDARDPYPKMTTLAERMGTSESMVRRYARQLERKGYLRRIARAGKSNTWNFDGLVEALEDQLRPNAGGGTFSNTGAELFVT